MSFLDSYDSKSLEKIVREGVAGEFWNIICKALDDNIENLDRVQFDEMNDYNVLPAEECKFRIALYKAKREHYTKLKNLPLNIFQSFIQREQPEGNLDPYRNSKDFLSKE